MTRRGDGSLTRCGTCGDDGERIVRCGRDGAVVLAFHGTAAHSLRLDAEQQATLVGLLQAT